LTGPARLEGHIVLSDRARLSNASQSMGIWLAAGLLILVPGLALLLVEWLEVTVPQSVGVGAAVVVGIALLLIIRSPAARCGCQWRATADSVARAEGQRAGCSMRQTQDRSCGGGRVSS
jgi:hypothetical protein